MLEGENAVFLEKEMKLLVLLDWITCMLTTLYYVRVWLKLLEPYKWMMFQKKAILTKHDQIGDPFWHLSDWFAIAWVVFFLPIYSGR